VPSVRNLQEAMHEASGHVARKESMCFCHAPTVWLAVETAENMAALNVDYSALIITVLGLIIKLFNSNLTFIFDLNYFLWFKTSKRQGLSFLLETKHKVFRFKTKPIP